MGSIAGYPTAVPVPNTIRAGAASAPIHEESDFKETEYVTSSENNYLISSASFNRFS